MITLVSYMLLALFFIGQVALLVSCPILSLILNTILGLIWVFSDDKS